MHTRGEKRSPSFLKSIFKALPSNYPSLQLNPVSVSLTRLALLYNKLSGPPGASQVQRSCSSSLIATCRTFADAMKIVDY